VALSVKGSAKEAGVPEIVQLLGEVLTSDNAWDATGAVEKKKSSGAKSQRVTRKVRSPLVLVVKACEEPRLG